MLRNSGKRANHRGLRDQDRGGERDDWATWKSECDSIFTDFATLRRHGPVASCFAEPTGRRHREESAWRYKEIRAEEAERRDHASEQEQISTRGAEDDRSGIGKRGLTVAG